MTYYLEVVNLGFFSNQACDETPKNPNKPTSSDEKKVHLNTRS